MNPQNLRGTTLIPMGFVQHAFYEALFELSHGFVK